MFSDADIQEQLRKAKERSNLRRASMQKPPPPPSVQPGRLGKARTLPDEPPSSTASLLCQGLGLYDLDRALRSTSVKTSTALGMWLHAVPIGVALNRPLLVTGMSAASESSGLATQLFSVILVEDAHLREATRRLQPQRATLFDAMEVEVRARAQALDGAALVAASA